MKHTYITFFNLKGSNTEGKLRKIEEWLIQENESILLLKLFKKEDFIKYIDYDHTSLKTAFISNLTDEKKEFFIKMLHSIAELYNVEFLDPFSYYYEIGLSIEEDYLNDFNFKKNV